MTRTERAVRWVSARMRPLGPRVGPLLRWIAGTRSEVLDLVPGDRGRYTALGALLVGTAVIATASMWFALGEVSDASWYLYPLLLLPALVWGGFILIVDRALITGVTTSRWRRTSTLVVRLVLAAALGTVIAEPLIVQVFGSAIESRIETQRAAEVDALRTGLLRCNPVPDANGGTGSSASGCDGLLLAVGTAGPAQAGRLAQLQQDASRLQTSLDADAARQRVLTDKAQDECAGVPGQGLSGVPGYGRLCLDAQAANRDFAATHPVQPRQGQLDGLRKQIEDLRGPAADSVQGFEAARNAQIEQRVGQLVVARPSIGLLERFDALDTLTAQHTGLWFREWFLRIFLIVIDCMPVLVKFIGGITAYDRAADRELLRDRDVFLRRTESERNVTFAAIEADEERQLHDIDAERRRHSADRTADEERQIAARSARLERTFRGEPAEDQAPERERREKPMETEDEIVQMLALLAARPLVQAMGSKAWAVVRDRWAAVFGRNRDGGEPQAAADLDDSADRIASGRATAEETRDEWRLRVEELLHERPDLVMDVRGLLDDPAPAERTTNGTRQNVRVRNGIAVQSGRDTTIGRSVGEAPEST